jgi:hypothetical protein
MRGPTGVFPRQPTIPGDHGGLNVEITVNRSMRRVTFAFGTCLGWVSVPAEDARAQARQLRALVFDAFGTLPYDPRSLPLRVEGERRTGLVVITMPEPLEFLVMNPEAVLGLADHLDVAAKRAGG